MSNFETFGQLEVLLLQRSNEICEETKSKAMSFKMYLLITAADRTIIVYSIRPMILNGELLYRGQLYIELRYYII